MTIAAIDYIVVLFALFVVVVKVVADFRQITKARLVRRRTCELARQAFNPSVTLLMPLDSFVSIRATLQCLRDTNLPLSVIVMIDPKVHSQKDIRALRRFVITQQLSFVRITARQHMITTDVARRYAKAGIVGLVPDTIRIHDSFYNEIILPFADISVTRVRAIASVRAGLTLASGLEALFSAWRHYIGIEYHQNIYTIGMFRRAESSFMFTNDDGIAHARTAYSVASRRTFSDVWREVSYVEVVTTGTLLGIVLGVLGAARDPAPLLIGIVLFCFLMAWWALSSTQARTIDKIALVLIVPLSGCVVGVSLAVRVIVFCVKRTTSFVASRALMPQKG